MDKKLAPITPGEILLNQFLKPLELSRNTLAREIFLPPAHISQIIKGTRPIKPDTALRLSRFFGTSPQFWLNLQQQYEKATQKSKTCTHNLI